MLEEVAHLAPALRSLVEVLLVVLRRLAPLHGDQRRQARHAAQCRVEVGAVADGVVGNAGDLALLAADLKDPAGEIRPVEAGQGYLEVHLEALAQRDDAEVVAEARWVDGEELRVGLVDLHAQLAPAGLHGELGADEVRVAGSRELALDAHPHEVAVLAVLLDPRGDLRLVGEADGAAVDAGVGVALALRAVLEEPAAGLRRVAVAQPQDLRARVGQRALGHVPDGVVDRGCLVEDHEDALALVVQAGEGLGVLFRPGDLVDAP